jgi:dTMP kinase
MELLKERLKGKFIVLDGPDGCGKSTQTELLIQWLQSEDVFVGSFRDPGDTVIGEKIREILLNPEHAAMNVQTEVMLYMAARSQLWAEKLELALRDNKCVVLDRWLSSTCAYQGFAGEFGIDRVVKIASDCLERVWPDLTIILDVDVKTASRRFNRQLDRMEAKGDGYHQKVRGGFLKLVEDYENFHVVDANYDIDMVHKKILQLISDVSFA